MLLEPRDVTKAFGSFKAVDRASVTLEQGDILGLIGPNGAGKSTLFNCLTGDLLSTSGKVLFEGPDITTLTQDARGLLPGRPGRKRLEIARALATEPKVLLLDEAMAGLTQREVQLAIDLVRDIHRSGVTLVIVEHIMEVIMSLATRVVVFHQGREIARGSPREVTSNPAVIEAYLGKRAAKAAAGHTPVELMGRPAT